MKKIDRFDKYMKIKGLNDNKVTIQLGLSVGSIGKSRRHNRDLSDKIVEQILNFYTDLNRTWLLTGEGEMLITNNVVESKQENGIPLIPIEAMAGSLTCEQIVMEYDCERYSLSMFKNADFLIPIKGDSMLPTYKSGDIVVCRRLPMIDLFFQWNKVYVVDTNQGPIIKRIKPGEKENSIKFVSDNPDNDPFELPLSEINAIALVIGVVRLE